ncbi:MAG: rhodanese-like domain-containing protein [Gemmataceae bacterium]
MPKQITVHELKAKLDAGEPVYLVDVRQEWEHEAAALPGSLLVPLDQLPARVAAIQPPAGAELVTYCHHGIRSLHAAAYLESAGFAEVASLAGGIDAWSRLIDAHVPRYR